MERLALFLSRSDVFLSVSPEEGQEIAQALMELGPGVDLPDVGGNLPPELEVRNLLALWWVVLSIPGRTHEANLARESLESRAVPFFDRIRDAFSSLTRPGRLDEAFSPLRPAGDPRRSTEPPNTLFGLLDALTWFVRGITLYDCRPSSIIARRFAGLPKGYFDLLGYGALAATRIRSPPLSVDQQVEVLRALSNFVPWLREDERNSLRTRFMGPLGIRMRAYSTSLFLSLYEEPHEGSTTPHVVTGAFQYYASPNNLHQVSRTLCAESSPNSRVVDRRMLWIIIQRGLCLVPCCSPLDRLYQQDTANVLALAKMVGSLPLADVLASVGDYKPRLATLILSQNLASTLLDRDPSSPFHDLLQKLVKDVIRDPSSDSLVSLAMFITFDSKFRFHFADRIRSDQALYHPILVKAIVHIATDRAIGSIKRSAAGVLLEALSVGMTTSCQTGSYVVFLRAIVEGALFSKSLPCGARAENLDMALTSCFELHQFPFIDVDLASRSGLETSILRALPLVRRYLGRCENGSEPPPPLLLLQALTNLVRSLGGILRTKQRRLLNDLRRDLREVRRLEKAAVAAGSRGAKARDMRLQVFRERSRVAEVRSQLETVGQAAGELRGLCGQLRVLGQEAMREIYFGIRST